MFDSSNGTDHIVTVGNSQSQDRYDKKSVKSDRRDMPNAVVGISMNRQGSSDDPSLEDPDDLIEVCNTPNVSIFGHEITKIKSEI